MHMLWMAVEVQGHKLGYSHMDVQGFGVHHALNPDPYRGPFGNDGKAYAADVKDLIASATPGRVRAGAGMLSLVSQCACLALSALLA